MALTVNSHEHFMKQALLQAEIALEEGEIPVGAVVVCENKIIARAYNQTERLNDVTAHAEMLAITSAANYLGGKYLTDCVLYVTLEPCTMCAGALFWSQLHMLAIGQEDDKRGFAKVAPSALHPKTKMLKGIMARESKQLLDRFFAGLRQK